MITVTLVLLTLQESLPDPDAKAAEVNGTVIRWGDVYGRLPRLRADEVRKEHLLGELRSQVEMLLISQEAERLRIEVTPRDLDEAVDRAVRLFGGRAQFAACLRARGWSEAEHRESCKRELLASLVGRRLAVEARRKGLLLDETVSAEEIRAFYAANRESFRELRRLKVIRLGLRWTFPWERDYKQELLQSFKQALDHGADFRTLAGTFSEIPGEGVPRDLHPADGILSCQMTRYLFESVATRTAGSIVWEANSVNS